MYKKVAAATAIAASLMMLGSPAFADTELDLTEQLGLVNTDETEIVSDINACHIDVNVIAVPVLSNNDQGSCSNPDLEVEVDD
ncbi:hypothetical protein FHS29_002846 [Saccharothrix tamanrassetensis]|uniref:Secreted protein n=1 Tax=Saccharothrix tamanrassetensis TaxID=1051531 RepID=A0A841CGZ7_9PSEU|nr:hypothetical protein [Saccharothrix tamanrassetensis]MBB5956260.1 hypothetical protein [Saccharothrix tamanrassetensis]